MVYIWLAILCLGVVVEIFDVGTLISIWFSVGAIIPLIMSFWDIATPWFICLEVLIFAIVTLLSILYLRRFVKKLLFRNNNSKVNLETLIGKKVKIVSEIKDKKYVKINDVEYCVIDQEEKDLQIGDLVKILNIEGNKFIVKICDKEEN